MIITSVVCKVESFYCFLMSQSAYSLRPRNQPDYALLNSGKQLQFPVYDISPLKVSRDPDEEGLSSSRLAAPAPLTSHPGEEFMELQTLLPQAKEEKKALEKRFNWRPWVRSYRRFVFATSNSTDAVMRHLHSMAVRSFFERALNQRKSFRT